MRDAGSLASNRTRLGLGQETLREPCDGNRTVTHSIKLINDILYIINAVFPGGLLSGWVRGKTAVSPTAAAAGTLMETNSGSNTSDCVRVIFMTLSF